MTLISVSPFLASFIGPVEKCRSDQKAKQNVLEYAYDFVVGFTKGNIEEHYIKDYSLFLFVLFLFLLVANNIGLMAKIRNDQWLQFGTSPTANLGYDFAFSFFDHLNRPCRRNSQTWCEGIFKGFCDTRIWPHEYFWKNSRFCLLGPSDLRKYLCGWGTSKLVCDFVASSCLLVSICLYWKHGVDSVFDFHFMYQAYVFTMLSSIYIGKKINGEE